MSLVQKIDIPGKSGIIRHLAALRSWGEPFEVKVLRLQPSRSDERLRKLDAGFTLIELLVVLAIIGLLAGLVGPQVMKHLGESKTKTAKLQIEELSSALDMFKLDVGRYPNSEEGLQSLVEQPVSLKYWNGPYLRKQKTPLDPWNNAYHYESPGQHGKFDLFSLGSDNVEGGAGEDQDITSWE
jgi:general secretion pathway protein G